MKKLAITLLAVAFSLPVFAAAKSTQAPAATTAQTQTKKTTKKHTKMHHRAKKNAKSTTATPAKK